MRSSLLERLEDSFSFFERNMLRGEKSPCHGIVRHADGAIFDLNGEAAVADKPGKAGGYRCRAQRGFENPLRFLKEDVKRALGGVKDGPVKKRLLQVKRKFAAVARHAAPTAFCEGMAIHDEGHPCQVRGDRRKGMMHKIHVRKVKRDGTGRGPLVAGKAENNKAEYAITAEAIFEPAIIRVLIFKGNKFAFKSKSGGPGEMADVRNHHPMGLCKVYGAGEAAGAGEAGGRETGAMAVAALILCWALSSFAATDLFSGSSAMAFFQVATAWAMSFIAA